MAVRPSQNIVFKTIVQLNYLHYIYRHTICIFSHNKTTRHGPNVINKFRSSIAKLCWNKTFWLADPSHMTFKQIRLHNFSIGQLFYSEFFCDNGSWAPEMLQLRCLLLLFMWRQFQFCHFRIAIIHFRFFISLCICRVRKLKEDSIRAAVVVVVVMFKFQSNTFSYVMMMTNSQSIQSKNFTWTTPLKLLIKMTQNKVYFLVSF